MRVKHIYVLEKSRATTRTSLYRTSKKCPHDLENYHRDLENCYHVLENCACDNKM